MTSLKDIQIALELLNERRPQLPELSCYICFYSDGSGIIYDGMDNELGLFNDESEIVQAISNIPGTEE